MDTIKLEELLDVMADAMLDPSLYNDGKRTSPSGNVIRKKVLVRALEAAELKGYFLTRSSRVKS
jgi:hypothetical protein